ncbi:winged helix DNA-binding protein [Oceanobacillus luteolus]|uniref:MarR family winged helix-turn-helix transcriptional regulator n=1 Tax=Oceanobacillus luteolus TaxID=1274358 RepID=A0ABW4HM99_9BACI|nr:helix-turn-helix domain-containing protein [Oceanobacillus luteolus]MCM3740511.1 winged helix DNA-binding protein [Oceanobacillus luteolus]
MEEELNEKDLFDLLSKKNREIRKAIEDRWNNKNEIQLTKSEWFILDRINYGQEMLADVCKNGEITRQGTHKLIRKLEAQGLVKLTNLDENKRNKYVQLTQLGLNCYEENKALKQALEERIKNALGQAAYDELKKTLAADWQL